MTEVFIAYTLKTPISLLRETLEAWDTEEYEPVAIEVKENRMEMLAQIAAEGLAKGDYILADLGTKPGDEKGVLRLKKGSLKVEKCQPH